MVLYKLGNSDKMFDLSNVIKIETKTSLQTIDKLTCSFKNEEILKQFLLNNNIITKEDLDKKIFIYYKNNRRLKHLSVMYSDEKEYFSGPLIHIKLSEYANNINFLTKIKNFYDFYYNSNINPQIANVETLEVILNDVNRDGYKALIYDKKLLDDTLHNIYIIATRTFDKKNNNYKFNYRGFRDIIHFVHTFDSMEKLKNLKAKIQDNYDYIDEKEEMARKNGKWILSSEGDPDFPPNSEEERKYLSEECEIYVNPKQYKL